MVFLFFEAESMGESDVLLFEKVRFCDCEKSLDFNGRKCMNHQLVNVQLGSKNLQTDYTKDERR